MSSEPRILDAEQTRAALPFGPLIAALREAFAAGAETPERHHHALPGDATLLLMPAWNARLLGTKLVTVHPANPARGLPAVHSLYLLASAETGQPLLLLDGGELTARRTAAVSALAGSLLARPGPLRMLLCGAGRVGGLLPRAWREVRAISEVAVWNPSPKRAERLIAELVSEGSRARLAGSLAEEVISTVRTAHAFGTQAVLSGLYDVFIGKARKVDMSAAVWHGGGLAIFFFVIYSAYALA